MARIDVELVGGDRLGIGALKDYLVEAAILELQSVAPNGAVVRLRSNWDDWDCATSGNGESPH
jgi:hypothetical protein